ncbi:MAG: hypothetical protein JO105_23545 [Hyphomicrobiales bacterium]|nr:hypothetical protein [Hyphomicrobiales bacterium]
MSNSLWRLTVPFVILAIPAAIVLINPAVPFGDTGCDSWAWFSLYTFNYERFWDYQHITYTTGRLPGLFPGYFVYHLFPPIVATYVFYFLLFWTALTAWYVAARQFAERWSALLATVLFAFTPYVLWVAGNSYIGGVRDCYVAISFAAALVYFRTQAKKALWTALVMIVLSIYTHLMTLVYLPAAVLFLVLGHLREKTSLSFWPAISGLAWRGLIALGSVTIAFGVLNELLVGRFWFFLPQFSKALLVWSRYDQDPVTLLDIVTRPFLLFVAFVLFDSIKWLREHNWSIRASLVSDYGIMLAIFWVQIAIMFVTQAALMRSEQTDEYNSMVVGFIFVVLSCRMIAVPSRPVWAGPALILGVVALGLAFSEPGLRADYMHETLKWSQGTIHLALLAVIAAALALDAKTRWSAQALLARSIGVSALCLASISAVSFTSYQPLVRGYEVFQNPRVYRAVYHALAAMNPLLPEGLPQIWSNVGVVPSHEHISYLLRHAISVASTTCPIGYFFETTFPKIEAGHIAPGDPLAIFVKADMTNALEEARAALAPLGLRFEFRGQTAIDYTGGPYVLIMGVVRESGA